MGRTEILLVDDEADYAETMAFWLKAKGYKVTIAIDGEKALLELKRGLPAIVFLDILMPGIDGIETLRRIRKDYPALPVIMVTAYASEDKKEEAQRLGVTGLFPKGGDFSNAAMLIAHALQEMKK